MRAVLRRFKGKKQLAKEKQIRGQIKHLHSVTDADGGLSMSCSGKRNVVSIKERKGVDKL